MAPTAARTGLNRKDLFKHALQVALEAHQTAVAQRAAAGRAFMGALMAAAQTQARDQAARGNTG